MMKKLNPQITSNILGLKIYRSLNWKEQVTTFIIKISQGIGMLHYSKRYQRLHTIQRMYYSIVDPHLRCYCSVLDELGTPLLLNSCKSSTIVPLGLSQTTLTTSPRFH